MEKKMQHELEDMLDPVKSVKKEWRLKKEEGSEGYTIIGYKGSRAEVVIPSRIGDERITNIGVKSMSPEYRPAQKERLDQITSITLSEGIERIEEYAFFGLKHLREVILPNSLIEIGYSAFRGCNELKELVIPPNIKKIDIYIVSQRDIDRIIYQSNDLSLMRSLFFSIYTRIYLKELVIQSKITTLKKFPDWSYCCEHIVLPESVTEIEDDALKGIEMVHAPAGSFVEQYAKLHNIPFKAV
jgi:hypothetical protein